MHMTGRNPNSPVRAQETGLLLYVPSKAASKARMVSNGRSNRGRVGLERSGSALITRTVSAKSQQIVQALLRTDNLPKSVFVLHSS
jgi:hypothetical protein